MAFIDNHREELGIEPICHELAIAPSSYHEHAARLADPGKRPRPVLCATTKSRQQIRRVHERQLPASMAPAKFGTSCGARKDQSGQMHRGAADAGDGAWQGVRRGKKTITTISNPKAPCPLDKVNREFRVIGPNALVGGRLYLCAYMGRLCVRGFRYRRLCPADRRLEGQHLCTHCQLRPGCPGTGHPCSHGQARKMG